MIPINSASSGTAPARELDLRSGFHAAVPEPGDAVHDPRFQERCLHGRTLQAVSVIMIAPTARLNPIRTGVFFRGQSTQIPSILSPKWDCSTKMGRTFHVVVSIVSFNNSADYEN